MTVRRYVTVWCDGVVDGGHDCGDEVFGHTTPEARREAKRAGWLTALAGGRDLCPEHIDQRAETTRWGEGGAMRLLPDSSLPEEGK